VASVRERISFFAETLGISLIAAAGQCHAEAKSDAMELVAQKLLQILCQGPIEIKTPNEIILNANGTELKLNGDGVFVHTKGPCQIHSTTLDKQDPESVPLNMPTNPHDKQFMIVDPETGEPKGGMKYRMVMDSGEVIEGVTGSDGKTERISTGDIKNVSIHQIN
jgi:type VI secretion system secreted protein VgrG